MKRYFYIIVYAILLAAGCTSSANLNVSLTDVLSPFKENFTENDQLIVFNHNIQGLKYQMKSADTEDGSLYIFHNVTDVKKEESSQGQITNGLIAYYPYSDVKLECSSSDNSYILKGIKIPSIQYYRDGQNEALKKLPLMASTMNDEIINLKPVMNYLEIRIIGSGKIKEISIRGNNNEKLSGEASIEGHFDDSYSIKMDKEANDEISLNFGQGLALSTKRVNEFTIAVPPVEFKNGFTLNITDTDGKTLSESITDFTVNARHEIKTSNLIQLGMPSNCVYYTTTDNTPLTVEDLDGANYFKYEFNHEDPITSNTYDGIGILTFAKDLVFINLSLCSKLESIILPSSIKVLGFSECANLRKVVLPNNLKEISTHSFYSCRKLEEINLPESLEEIRIGAFESCKSITHIKLPKGLKSIEYDAFKNCTSLESIEIPKGVEFITCGCFKGCISLQKVILPNSLGQIGDEAFLGCTLLSDITIPKGLDYIGKESFKDCMSLEKVDLPPSMKVIGKRAFSNCLNLSKANIKMHEGEIRGGAFEECHALTEVQLNEGVQIIRNDAFRECSSLKSIVIPESVQLINECAFEYCDALEDVYLKSHDGYPYREDAFDKRTVKHFYIPRGTLDSYTYFTQWRNLRSKLIETDF